MSNAADKWWGKTRIEALSDGVFAIVVTLLVLDIRIPELPRHAANREVLHAMAALGPTFFAFTITFVLAVAFWYMHHLTFHNITYVTRAVVFLNLPFLMFVSLLPFSTGLLARVGLDHPIGLTVYFANQLALGLALNAQWAYARRHKLLVSPLTDPAGRFMIATQPFSCIAALVTIPFVPALSYYALLITAIIFRRVARRRFKAIGADAPAEL
jgi:TMEM175 potassium channel family protein